MFSQTLLWTNLLLSCLLFLSLLLALSSSSPPSLLFPLLPRPSFFFYSSSSSSFCFSSPSLRPISSSPFILVCLFFFPLLLPRPSFSLSLVSSSPCLLCLIFSLVYVSRFLLPLLRLFPSSSFFSS